ncbi:hypothetical protein GQ85_33210, partial [Rhodococcus rhodochrous]
MGDQAGAQLRQGRHERGDAGARRDRRGELLAVVAQEGAHAEDREGPAHRRGVLAQHLVQVVVRRGQDEVLVRQRTPGQLLRPMLRQRGADSAARREVEHRTGDGQRLVRLRARARDLRAAPVAEQGVELRLQRVLHIGGAADVARAHDEDAGARHGAGDTVGRCGRRGRL